MSPATSAVITGSWALSVLSILLLASSLSSSAWSSTEAYQPLETVTFRGSTPAFVRAQRRRPENARTNGCETVGTAPSDQPPADVVPLRDDVGDSG